MHRETFPGRMLSTAAIGDTVGGAKLTSHKTKSATVFFKNSGTAFDRCQRPESSERSSCHTRFFSIARSVAYFPAPHVHSNLEVRRRKTCLLYKKQTSSRLLDPGIWSCAARPGSAASAPCPFPKENAAIPAAGRRHARARQCAATGGTYDLIVLRPDEKGS